jgi:hypothetical protein
MAAWVRRAVAVVVVVGLRLTAWAAWASRSWMPAFVAVVVPGAMPGAARGAGNGH